MIASIILIVMLLYLSISLAIGFWLLTSAVKQIGWLKILGLILGWVIIIFATIVALTSCYMMTKHPFPGQFTKNCPMYQMMHQNRTQQEGTNQTFPMMNKSTGNACPIMPSQQTTSK